MSETSMKPSTEYQAAKAHPPCPRCGFPRPIDQNPCAVCAGWTDEDVTKVLDEHDAFLVWMVKAKQASIDFIKAHLPFSPVKGCDCDICKIVATMLSGTKIGELVDANKQLEADNTALRGALKWAISHVTTETCGSECNDYDDHYAKQRKARALLGGKP